MAKFTVEVLTRGYYRSYYAIEAESEDEAQAIYEEGEEGVLLQQAEWSILDESVERITEANEVAR